MAVPETEPSLCVRFYERLGPEYEKELEGRRLYTTETVTLVPGKTAEADGQTFTHAYKWRFDPKEGVSEKGGGAVPAPCHGTLSIGDKELNYDIPTVKTTGALCTRALDGSPINVGTMIDLTKTVDVSSLPTGQTIVAWNTKSSNLVARIKLKRIAVRGSNHTYTPTGELYCYYPRVVQVWTR